MIVKRDLSGKREYMKKIFIVITALLAYSKIDSADDYIDLQSISKSYVNENSKKAALEKQYRKTIDGLYHEITNFKTSRMLYDTAVHTKSLEDIEKRFNQLKQDLQQHDVLNYVSRYFLQRLSSLEREIFDARELMGNPENIMNIVE